MHDHVAIPGIQDCSQSRVRNNIEVYSPTLTRPTPENVHRGSIPRAPYHYTIHLHAPPHPLRRTSACQLCPMILDTQL